MHICFCTEANTLWNMSLCRGKFLCEYVSSSSLPTQTQNDSVVRLTRGHSVNWWRKKIHFSHLFWTIYWSANTTLSINKTWCTSLYISVYSTKLNHILWFENSRLDTDACVCHHKQKLRHIYLYCLPNEPDSWRSYIINCCQIFSTNQAIPDKSRGW